MASIYPYNDSSLFGVPSSSALTAVGTTQATALALSNIYNNITTAAAGTGVNLPNSQAGVRIIIANNGANPIKVYASPGFSDTINGVVGSTGVSQGVSSVIEYFCFAPGAWLAQGAGTGAAGQYPTFAAADSLTAAGSNRATALALTAPFNRLATVAASTGVVLPAAAPGMFIVVANSGASTLAVYAAGSDTINGTAGATGITQAATKVAIYFSMSVGNWVSILTA